MHKAWDIEAQSVAQNLALSPELTTKLVDAYKAARESQLKAMQAKMTPGARPEPGVIMDIAKAEKAKFETALKGFLNAEQTTKALATLGALDFRWDRMVVALDDMNLDDKTKAPAMKLVSDFIAESSGLVQAGPGDMREMFQKLRPLREKLDAELAKVLSADQMAKWKEATAVRGGMGGRRSMGRGPEAPAPAPEPKAAEK